MVELLAVDPGVGPLAAIGDSSASEHNALLRHIAAMAEPSVSTVTMKNLVVVQTMTVIE